MSFNKGSVSFRAFHLPNPIPGDYVEKFSANALPGCDDSEESPGGCCEITGWCGHRHLADRNITEETITKAGSLFLQFVEGERKIPTSVLKTECAIEEMAALAAEGKAFLKRQERAEIRKAVVERLTPKMPLILSGIEVVEGGDNRAYSTATSDSACDTVIMSWQHALGTDASLIPITPATASLLWAGKGLENYDLLNLAPDHGEVTDGGAGEDFLTWLWYYSEREGGMLGNFALMIEGPLAFVHEGQGAHETILRKGMPTISAEAKQALMSGKKLRKAKITVSKGDDVWSFGLDAAEWIFSGTKVPTDKSLDPVSRFQEKVLGLDALMEFMKISYTKFLEIMSNPIARDVLVEDMREWVNDRQAKS